MKAWHLVETFRPEWSERGLGRTLNISLHFRTTSPFVKVKHFTLNWAPVIWWSKFTFYGTLEHSVPMNLVLCNTHLTCEHFIWTFAQTLQMGQMPCLVSLCFYETSVLCRTCLIWPSLPVRLYNPAQTYSAIKCILGNMITSGFFWSYSQTDSDLIRMCLKIAWDTCSHSLHSLKCKRVLGRIQRPAW